LYKNANFQESREKVLEKMEEYPFIKKFNIPSDFTLDMSYLTKSLKELI